MNFSFSVSDLASPGAFAGQISLLHENASAGIDTARTQTAASAGKCEPLRRALLASSGALFEDSWGSQMKCDLMGSTSAARTFQLAYNKYLGRRNVLPQPNSTSGSSVPHWIAGARYRQSYKASRSASARYSTDSETASIPLSARKSVPALADGAKRGNVPGVRAFLPSGAAALTIRGLARLTGAETDAQRIACGIAGGPVFESPSGSGRRHGENPSSASLVLPPVARALCRDVYRLIQF